MKYITVRIMPNTTWAHKVDEMSTKAKQIVYSEDDITSAPKENEEYTALFTNGHYKLINRTKPPVANPINCESDFDDDTWQPCDKCDIPDACNDFGCAIQNGVKRPVEW